MFEELAQKVMEKTSEFGTLIKSMDEIEEWNSWEEFIDNINNVMEFVRGVVIFVEEANTELGGIATSKEKKQAAIEAIDAYIKLPAWMEPFDNFAIGFMVDKVVEVMNTTLWKEV